MINADLLMMVAGLAGVLLTAWLLAVAAGPDWLRPGHGPLWYGASVLSLLMGSAAALLQQLGVVRPHHLLGLPGTFNAAVLALIGLIALFPVLALLLTQLYRPGPAEPPIPRSFLYFGIAPDGSPLLELRWMLRVLAAVGLAVATLAILGMDLSSVPGSGPKQHTLWAFGYAALLGVLFGSTHPVRPVPEPRRASSDDEARPPLPFGERVDALHRWLGNPVEAEWLPAVARDRKGAKAADHRFGLDLYPYQGRLIDEAGAHPAVALAGPEGSGRTTAALLRAIDLALATGASCTVVCPDRERVHLVWRHARALTERISAGAAVTVDDGLPPRAADLWVVSLDDLERFLDDTADPAAHPLLQRLRLIVVDDVERLYGPAVARARFLLFRLEALRQAQAPQLILVGNLAPQVLQQVAERIATRAVKVISTAGENDAAGAASRPVRRFVVEPGRIDHKSTSTVGLLGVREGFARVVTEVDDPSQRLRASLLGEPWSPWPLAAEASPDLPAEVLLARVGPRSAWHVLGHRRYYAEAPAPAHEYLMFADDAMSQLLLRQFRGAGRQGDGHRSWWPVWYDTSRFPRILSAVPGGNSTPQGLQTQARGQLRAVLDKGFVDLQRLEAVFSPEVARQVLDSLETSRIFERFEGWRPNPADPKKPQVLQLVRAQGAVEADRDRRDHEWADLRATAVGRSWQVPAALLDFQYYDGALLQLDGKRYRVQVDKHQARTRLLVEEPTAVTATPIRALRFRRHGQAPLDSRFPRYGGQGGLETLRCAVQLALTHQGVHTFGYSRDHLGGSGDSLQRLYEEMLPQPVSSASFVTRAWLVCPPPLEGTSPEVVLHTLSHVLRDCLDYFFLGASEFIGVGYEMDFEGRAGLVFYDRHPEGLGCLDDIDDAKDLQAILAAAREILAGCDCDSSCSRCCRSVTCTRRPHNHDLDRHQAVRVLDALLSRSGASS